MSGPRTITVVGGGLAGITAAIRLADAGCRVTLLESRPRLGGLTHSFRRGDLDVDNGQHVFLRCCTSYRALLERLGTAHLTELQSRLDVPVVSGRKTARLKRNSLPAPLHLGRSLASYGVLAPADRLRAVRGAMALRGVDRDDPRTDDVAFGEWLTRHGQNGATVEALWDLVGVATMNVRADEASLAVAATVFQLGLLTDSSAGDIGWSAVPLQRLHGDAAARVLTAAGADVRLRTRVRALDRDGAAWIVRTDDDALTADAVVVATDPAQAESLLPIDALAQPAGWAAGLGTAPIVNVNVLVDRPVLSEPFVAVVGSDVQWIFDRTRQSGLGATRPGRAQLLAISLSAADDVIDLPVAELRVRLMPALEAVLPALRDATVLDFFVTREPQATFRPRPGTAVLRPANRTALPGLVVAGAYTATGWPATMESAVRSGDAAAAVLLSAQVAPAQAVAV
ncbi:MAG: FAD-dependent oxidoreductase [Frankiales bacterium]|nr:FAD-dependent oxidoreductase [Frankiales bacterium]